MADLRSCYFCGTGPDGSLESYGVVPSALDPSQDEQRSVVLCPDCRGKLTALLRPVVDAAGSPARSSAGSPGSGGLSPADDEVTGLAESGGDGGSDPAEQTTSAGDSAANAGGSAGDSAADERDGTGEPSDRSVSFDESSEGGGEPSGSDSGLAASSDGSDGGTPESRPRDPSAEALMGDDNEAYRKVIRLLQNREFPIRRAEIEDLATNAYQLAPGECSDAIDAIVQKGLLVEEEGTLRRPEG